MSDYIDRQTYIAALDYPEPEFFDDFRAGWIYGLSRAEAAIRKAPAADVAPILHGEWGSGRFNDMTGDYEEQCTNCGEWSKECGKPYCPNCGARMDGGK